MKCNKHIPLTVDLLVSLAESVIQAAKQISISQRASLVWGHINCARQRKTSVFSLNGRLLAELTLEAGNRKISTEKQSSYSWEECVRKFK